VKAQYPNEASEFIALRTYCRWLEDEGRRETWNEVTDRVLSFLRSEASGSEDVPSKVWTNIKGGMLNFNVLPSMRLVATAGEAAKKDNLCLYNCSYTPIDTLKSFSEILYILMCGTGVGFSVEREYINKLPIVNHQDGTMRDDYIIEDSREGWAKAFLFGLETWFGGEDVIFNFSKIRPYGAPLKTFGGRASGPDPFKELIEFTREIIINAAGRKLKAIECHDIACKTAVVVLSGAKRRSACISFSDIDDVEMREAKKGQFPLHRYKSNNSVVFKEKPDTITFLREWSSLAESGTGERGIFNISNLEKICSTRTFNKHIRCNPCGEILLDRQELCNLSTVVIRAEDDLDDLVSKVKTATWLGMIQSTFTHFPFLREKWRKNAEEERLIGVCLTGQLDNPDILTDQVLVQLKKVVLKTAKRAAKILDINEPKAYTTVKPAGNTSELTSSSAGCHCRWSKYYIRRYRISKSDPLFHLVRDQGIPWEAEEGQTKDNATTVVVSFPVKSPSTCITRHEWSCMDQLKWYLKLQKHWSTHNVSCTVYVKKDEWLKVGNWVYDNFDDIVGITFLPSDDHVYKLAPYTEIDEETYNEEVKKFPKLDFSKLGNYEKASGDTTEVSQILECTGGACKVE